ncbi:MAG: preprotein translocase subunit SecG [Candidatus Latescibacteria bacterium]|nr:preprotein translocase subunit SecG [bacterium]MBD3423367.1 preprotein translocase subunit SecG [Candidatus Latescibacterota bacterium]
MIFGIFITIHVIACVLLIIVVLMQSSKGGGLSGAFGGMGSQAVMGGREAASFLSRATTYLAVIFMVTSLSLAFLSAGQGTKEQESVLKKAAQQRNMGTMVPEAQKDVDEILRGAGEEEAAPETGGADST